MTLKVTSNNIEGGGGVEMYLSFPFIFKSAFLDGNPPF